jgi:uncharacterized protein (DUF1778 family)
MATTLTTTIRLTPAAKRRLAAAARRRGVSTHKFILDAALERADGGGSDAKLARLEAVAARLQEAVTDERDYRAADAAWQRHVQSGAKTLKPEEAWRELGL